MGPGPRPRLRAPGPGARAWPPGPGLGPQARAPGRLEAVWQRLKTQRDLAFKGEHVTLGKYMQATRVGLADLRLHGIKALIGGFICMRLGYPMSKTRPADPAAKAKAKAKGKAKAAPKAEAIEDAAAPVAKAKAKGRGRGKVRKCQWDCGRG